MYDEALVSQVSSILDEIHRSDTMTSDQGEEKLDATIMQVRGLPRVGILEAIDKAIGRSKARRRAALYVLAELTDVPGVVERIGEELANADPSCRRNALAVVGLRQLTKLAPSLNDIIMHDPDERCRRMSIWAAGRLKQAMNLSALLAIAQCGRLDSSVIRALGAFGSEAARPYLWRAFEAVSSQDDRVLAAWGLAKLGDAEALRYLGEMLYDPVVKTPTSYDPGHSLRAAQAIADVFKLPFEWRQSYVRSIRTWWEGQREVIPRAPE